MDDLFELDTYSVYYLPFFTFNSVLSQIQLEIL